MPKKVKYLLLFILVFVGLALIVGNQVWSQSSCGNIGNFAEAIFDDGEIKVMYDSCTGDINYVCFECSSTSGSIDPPYDENCGQGPCGTGYVQGQEKVLYLCTTDTSPTDSDCRRIENVGPGTGCACYGSPGCIIVRGKAYCY